MGFVKTTSISTEEILVLYIAIIIAEFSYAVIVYF